MADVVLLHDNVQFMHIDNGVPNPTYGRYGGGTDLELVAMSTDYQSVSEVHPQYGTSYSTVDISKKTRFRSDSPEEDGPGGMPIPQPQHATTNGYHPKSYESSTGYSPHSIASSYPSCGSPTPLLPPPSLVDGHSGAMFSQNSQTSSHSSSSNSECIMDGARRPSASSCSHQATFSSEYSYACNIRRPSSTSRMRSISESEGVQLSQTAVRIKQETETMTSFGTAEKKHNYGLETTPNISYNQFRSTGFTDNLKVNDSTTTFEIIVGIFAIVSIIVSVVVIILFGVLYMQQGDAQQTGMGGTTNIDQPLIDSNDTSSEECGCAGMICTLCVYS